MAKKDKIGSRMDEALTPDARELTEEFGEIFGMKPKTDRDLSMLSLYLTPEIRSHLDRLSKDWGTNRSQVAKWLLEAALAKLGSGELEPPEIGQVPRARL